MCDVTIREALKRASLLMEAVDDGAFLAEIIIRHVLQLDRTQFFLQLHEPLDEVAWTRIEALVKQRLAGIPLQYLLGEQEFYGLSFYVNPAVLIPRPETEILVEEVLRNRDKQASLQVADIGTGSGAIAITLAKHSKWHIYAIDIAQESLDTAEQNSKRNEVEEQITFLQGDLLAPLPQQVDILVSNPPYIPRQDILALDVQVREHEPLRALDGGVDGLDFYRRICKGIPQVLRAGGMVAFEVGFGQANEVAYLVQQTGMFEQTRVICDLAGVERIVLGL